MSPFRAPYLAYLNRQPIRLITCARCALGKPHTQYQRSHTTCEACLSTRDEASALMLLVAEASAA